MDTEFLLQQLKGGLIVSCQPEAKDAERDPMNKPEIMAALAQAARLGGAAGLRADTPGHIGAIRAAVNDLPIIGIYKHDLAGYEVRITPTVELALAVARAGASFVAVDATERPRPEGGSAAGFIRLVRAATGGPVMADIATFEEGLAAAEAGACAVLTTLSGYTGSPSAPQLPYGSATPALGAGAREREGGVEATGARSASPQPEEPDYDLVYRLARALSVPVIAEGRYASPQQAARALECGAWAVTVGSAITRPRVLTELFVAALRGGKEVL